MLGDDSRSITAGIIHFFVKKMNSGGGRAIWIDSLKWSDKSSFRNRVGEVGGVEGVGGGGGEDNTPINSPRWMFLLIHWFYSSFISISFGRKRRRGRAKVGVGGGREREREREKTQRFVTLPRDSMQMKSVWFDLIRPTDSIWIVTRSTRRIFVVIAPILV